MSPSLSSSFTDALGVRHPIAVGEPRIVSLVPSITELLFALGLGQYVVGRTTYCVHPAEAIGHIPSVGGTKRLQLERIKRLQPTHVVANIEENLKTEVEAISEWLPRVIVTYPLAPRDNLCLFRLLGSIFSRPVETGSLCEQFESRYTRLIEQRAARPRRQVLYLIWRKPWMSVSTHTYIGRMLELVNWHTPFSDPEDRYPIVEAGSAVARHVDKVLFSSEPFPFKNHHLEAFARQFGVEVTRLAKVDGELMSWYGCRAIAGLDYLATLAEPKG